MSDPRKQARARLQDLARAGVDRLPRPRRATKVAGDPTATTPELVPVKAARAEPAPQPAVAAPTRPFRANADASSLFSTDGLAGQALPVPERILQLEVIAREVAACPLCPELVATRTLTVPGEGSPSARLMFIGEAPGETEDRTGRPFVGRAGQLLNDMITKGMGLRREDVFIANTLKCRPPGNRDPLPEEQRNCFGYLERQIETVRPEFICLLGRPAALAILGTALPLKHLRQKWHRYRGIPTIATLHPAYLLRNPPAKKDAWEDLQMLMNAMGLAPPRRAARDDTPG